MENFNQVEKFDQETAVELTREFVHATFEQEREDLVYLPIGVKFEGQVIRLVQIKEPDGYTEELQSSENYRKSLSGVVNATLADCIVDIPSFDLPQNRDKAIERKTEIVKLMAEPDRQYIMSRIHKLEHGDTMKANLSCSHCGGQTTEDVNLYSDFTIHYINEELLGDADRMIIRDVELTHPITMNGKSFDRINVRIPNGATSASLEKADNMGNVITRMILNMIACNLDKFTPNENEIRRWTKKIRHGLITDLGERRTGFINSVEFTCDHCNRKSKSTVQVTNFLAN